MMKTIKVIIALLITSNFAIAQNENEVIQFDKSLNQFLNVRDFCISNEGNEAYFSIQSPNQEISQLASIKKENEVWLAPEILPFCDSYMYLEPFLSPDGKRLYFSSNRPFSSSGTNKKDFDIWFVERNNQSEKWSSPINAGLPINSDLDEFYPSISENNNIYFTMESPHGLGKDDIYVSKWNGSEYSNPVLLNEKINSVGYEFNAFISRQENFILFTKYNEKDGQGSGDLYLSIKDAIGEWEKAKNIGTPINTKYMEYCPYYDEQNQVLYFTSKRNSLSPRKFEDISDFQKYIYESENGLSKIYMVPFKIN